MRIAATLVLVIALPGVAAADPASWSFGARVGGYGFRQAPADGSRSGWNDCRMNGLGLFGERSLSDGSWFLQGGVDMYFAESFPMSPDGDAPMDRVSGLGTVAAGFRMFPGSRVSPHLQVGAGVEATHVTMLDAHRDGSFLLPFGFLGIGGDVGLGDHLRLGLTLRALMMGLFEDSLDPGYAPAAQVQFYAKYDL